MCGPHPWCGVPCRPFVCGVVTAVGAMVNPLFLKMAARGGQATDRPAIPTGDGLVCVARLATHGAPALLHPKPCLKNCEGKGARFA